MGAAASALLGALVGGLLTLTATFYAELRRDRRRQIGAARLVAAEMARSEVELMSLGDQADEDHPWVEGPHPAVSSAAWQSEARYFVGALSDEDFRIVDAVAAVVHSAGEFGFTLGECDHLILHLRRAEEIVKPLTRVRWVDRHVWRL